jgi:putative peptide zinc metalloprotease protein
MGWAIILQKNGRKRPFFKSMSITISPRVTFTQVGTTEQFLLEIDSRVMYVSRLLYLIIYAMQQEQSTSQILDIVNQSAVLSRPLELVQLELIIKNKIAPLDLSGTSLTETKEHNRDIRLRLVLLRFPQIVGLLNGMHQIYRPNLFWPLFAISFVISLSGLLPQIEKITNTETQDSTWIVLLFAMFVLMLFHELGHAAASWHYGVEPKEIGMGVYLLFPVFYANVTGVWKLPAKQRVIVNLAGVYIQLLVNLLIIGATYMIVDVYWKTVSSQLALVNLFSVIANLNPFLKFDGYWVVADIFRLPNLRRSSNEFLKSAIKLKPDLKQPTLAIYSIIKGIFIVGVLLVMVKKIPDFFHKTYIFAIESANSNTFHQAFYREAFYRTLGVILLSYFAGRLLLSLVRPMFAVREKVKT